MAYHSDNAIAHNITYTRKNNGCIKTFAQQQQTQHTITAFKAMVANLKLSWAVPAAVAVAVCAQQPAHSNATCK